MAAAIEKGEASEPARKLKEEPDREDLLRRLNLQGEDIAGEFVVESEVEVRKQKRPRKNISPRKETSVTGTAASASEGRLLQ